MGRIRNDILRRAGLVVRDVIDPVRVAPRDGGDDRGGVKCWGYNQDGALGNGSQTSSSIPVEVTGFASGGVDVSMGYQTVCARTSTGSVRCWGIVFDEIGGHLQTVAGTVEDVSDAVVLSAGGSGACARSDASSGVFCWGNNQWGQLGNDSTTTSTSGVYVEGSTFMSLVSAGTNHACGVVLGAAVCWGHNQYGTLGNGTTSNSSVPVGVTGLGAGVADIESGNVHTCAVTTAGAVHCWGRNTRGQLGIDPDVDGSLVPVEVVGL